MLAVVIVALPLATRPVEAPAATDAAATAASLVIATSPPAIARPQPTLGPHGDDVGTAASDPPVDRQALIRRAQAAPMLSGYRWPIRNARITNTFGKGSPGGFVIDGVTAHDGLDLSTFCGDRIVAAHDGVVLSAGRKHQSHVGWVGDLTAFRERLDSVNGWRSQAIAVVIDDGNGYRSIYVHLSLAVVKAGDVVEAGQLLGYEGATGNATGCHLHYSLFNPNETDTWALETDVVKRSLLPEREIARIDPLRVLPPLSAAGITWGWGVVRQD